MGIYYVDKPKGITSFDVCFKLRRVLGTKKIGHTGTLDPNATGVMIVLSDKDSKANQFLVTDSKRYFATCILGYQTDTLDIDGKIIEEKECNMPSKEEIEKVLNSFLGKSKQIPPMTSAIKVDGKKLYEYQREGKTVELKARDIEIYDIELVDIKEKEFSFNVSVSSGTYIRVLLKDILDKLNLVGTLKELRRTRIDNVDINDCIALEEILNGKIINHNLYELLSKKYKTIEIEDPKDVLNGKPLKLDADDELVLIAKDNKCLAIYEKDRDLYRSKRGLF